MSTIDELRGLVERAKHTGDFIALDRRLETALPALLAVAEAARKVAEMYKAFRLCSMYTRTMDEHDADLTRAIAAEKAVELDPTASAIVREGGGESA